jgi:hypothetical protein
MKTTKIISAITLVLILAANSLFASRTTINDPVSSVNGKMIIYEVKVNVTANFPGSTNFLVAITDENGRRVVPAQPFHPGVWTYLFKEAGSIKGTRIAVLVPYPANPTGWIIPPSKRSGTFYGGASYLFELTPNSLQQTKTTDL